MPTSLKTPVERTSYALGLDVGSSLRRLPVALNLDAFVQGFRDINEDRQPQLSREEFAAVMGEFKQHLQEQGQKVQGEAGGKNQAASDDFLAGNKVRPGVMTTDSGLQYEIVAKGVGTSPSTTDVVTVHYTGTLIDGTVFDSSVERGEPVKFPVDGVIPGWTEALQLMKVGAKYRLFIPPALAYGERGAGQDIGPNQALVFDVELLSIEPA